MSDGTVDELRIIVRSEMRNALRDLDLLDEKTDRSEKSFKKMAGTMVKKGLAIASVSLSIRALILELKKSIDTASDIREDLNRMDVILEEDAAGVRRWADSLGDAVGRSRYELGALVATAQDTLVPLGVTQSKALALSKMLTEHATDMSSFYNMETSEIFSDLMSMAVGEYEPMRKFGTVINETRLKQEGLNRGLWDGVGAMDAATKAEIAIALTMEGTQKAIGDAARTADEYANQVRRASAIMEEFRRDAGEMALQGLSPLLKWFNDVAEKALEAGREIEAVNKAINDIRSGNIDIENPQENQIKALNTMIDQNLKNIQYMQENIASIRNHSKGGAEEAERELNALIEETKELENQLNLMVQMQAYQQLENHYNEQARIANQEYWDSFGTWYEKALEMSWKYQDAKKTEVDKLKEERAIVLDNLQTAQEYINLHWESAELDEGKKQALGTIRDTLREQLDIIDEQIAAELAKNDELEKQLSLRDEILQQIAEEQHEQAQAWNAYNQIREELEELEGAAGLAHKENLEAALDVLREMLGITHEITDESENTKKNFEEAADSIANAAADFTSSMAAGSSDLKSAVADLAGTAASLAGGSSIVGSIAEAGFSILWDAVETVINGIKGEEIESEFLSNLTDTNDTLENEIALREEHIRSLKQALGLELDVLRQYWQKGRISSSDYIEGAQPIYDQMNEVDDYNEAQQEYDNNKSSFDNEVSELLVALREWREMEDEIRAPGIENALSNAWNEFVYNVSGDRNKITERLVEELADLGYGINDLDYEFLRTASWDEIIAFFDQIYEELMGEPPEEPEKYHVSQSRSSNTTTVINIDTVYGIEDLEGKLQQVRNVKHNRGYHEYS